MELKRAFKLLRKDVWAVASAVYILIVTLAALFAYTLSSDKTQYANQMHLSIHSQPPGFSCNILIIPSGESENNKSFFFGGINKNEEIPIKEIIWFDNGLSFKRYGNAMSYIEERSFDQFPPGTTRKKIEAEYLKEKHFILGTDKYGRDLLSRLIIGSRISISIGLVAVIISLFIGILFGSLAGFFGGFIDKLIMWLINVVWSIPTLLMVIAITLALGRGFWQVFIAVGMTMWVEVARIVRGQVISIREKPYIKASISLGFTNLRIILFHIFPMIIPSLIVISSANFASAILIESGLSFLGIGTQPPIPSWGSMIKEHFRYILLGKAYLAIFPGFAIMSLVLAFMTFGNSIRDLLDERN